MIGCPEVRELYEINRQAKMQYKYAVRWLTILKNKLLKQLRFSIVFKNDCFVSGKKDYRF